MYFVYAFVCLPECPSTPVRSDCLSGYRYESSTYSAFLWSSWHFPSLSDWSLRFSCHKVHCFPAIPKKFCPDLMLPAPSPVFPGFSPRVRRCFESSVIQNPVSDAISVGMSLRPGYINRRVTCSDNTRANSSVILIHFVMRITIRFSSWDRLDSQYNAQVQPTVNLKENNNTWFYPFSAKFESMICEYRIGLARERGQCGNGIYFLQN